MTDQRLPVYAIQSLGLIQIIDYGTLYYSLMLSRLIWVRLLTLGLNDRLRVSL